jgi:hypothetical protein
MIIKIPLKKEKTTTKNTRLLRIQIFLFSFLSKKSRITLLLSLALLCMTYYSLNGQFLKDSTSIKLIKKGIDYVYNFKFSEAHKVSDEIRKLYPKHPVNWLLNGMIIYWENYPMNPTSSARELFEADLRKCIEDCGDNKDPSSEAEILLVNLCARGLLLLYFTENDLSFEVFPLAAGTYQCIRRSFNFTARYSDFYFFTGVYDYYREAYPEAHPVYKTLAFLFPKGSKTEGLEALRKVSKNSIVLKAEAYSFLTTIFLSFENDYPQATFYSKSLHAVYPDNTEYLGSYIKNLLLIKKYDEAEMEIRSAVGYLKDQFFQAKVTIFNGILQEKKYHDIRKAQQMYNKGIKDIAPFRIYGNEYAAYAYFGLSRISELSGDMANQKTYQKLALKLADFKNVNFNN